MLTGLAMANAMGHEFQATAPVYQAYNWSLTVAFFRDHLDDSTALLEPVMDRPL